jgi:proteasome component ECM29
MNECVLPFQTKLGIVKFLVSGVMTDSDILVHLIVAAADTRFSVANAADMQLKKIVGLVREFICVGWHMEC